MFKTMSIYQTDYNTLVWIKEKIHKKITTHTKQNLIYKHTFKEKKVVISWILRHINHHKSPPPTYTEKND